MTSSEPVAIVTGGSRNVGRTITEALVEANHLVAICARTLEDLERTRNELPRVEIRVLDIRHRQAIYGWVEQIVGRYGRIDVLVNNAAVMPPLGPFVENPLDEWQDTLIVNLMGAVTFTRAVLPHMIARRRGRIINLGGGGSAYPRPDHSAYACSKAALVRFSDTIAEEVRDYGIKVNVLSPGKQYSKMREQDLALDIPFPAEWDDPKKLKALTRFLVEADVTGKFLQINDDYPHLTEKDTRSNLYTLRRIEP